MKIGSNAEKHNLRLVLSKLCILIKCRKKTKTKKHKKTKQATVTNQEKGNSYKEPTRNHRKTHA